MCDLIWFQILSADLRTFSLKYLQQHCEGRKLFQVVKLVLDGKGEFGYKNCSRWKEHLSCWKFGFLFRVKEQKQILIIENPFIIFQIILH